MKSVHFVTGATGFVGAALVLELLQRTSDDVVCLVRPHGAFVTTRLHEALLHAAKSYGAPESVIAAIRERCRAVAGDVEQPGCGVAEAEIGDCSQFWHSAASLRFEDRYAEEISRVNVQGTAHALELAGRLGATQFNYVSTAYVCGSREGTILETEQPADVPLNNHYERSKVAAESLVIADPRFARRIFRPSIVIGHSRTLAATNFTGIYGFLRKLNAFQGMMARTQKGLMARKSVRLRLDVEGTLDLVPIDRVAANAVTIALSTKPVAPEIDYYHLTNPHAPRTASVVDTMAELTGLSPMTFVKGNSDFDWLDEQFNSRIDFYASYLNCQKTFDRKNVVAIVGVEPSEPYAMSVPILKKYCGWYLDLLNAERAGLPETR